MKAVILSGGGDYSDPWHPFAQTSAAVAALLQDAGFDVEVRDDVARAVTSMKASPRLLVVNFGSGGIPAEQDQRTLSGLSRLLMGGAGMLGLHTASTLFPQSAHWAGMLGGRWVRGTSMHPPHGRLRVRVTDSPLTSGLPDFDTVDEAYSLLAVEPGTTVVAGHDEHGTGQPIWWYHRHQGIRVAYDALGHDADAYRAETHRLFLARAARWAARADSRPRP